jgi:hypothetical protein
MQITVKMTQTIDVNKFVKKNVFNPTVAALNQVSTKLVKAAKEQMKKDFDRPNPFTLRGVAVASPATADQAEPTVVIAVLPQQARYLGLEVLGGVRKVGDYATAKAGIVMPGPDVELNAYGNLPRGYLKRLLSRKQAFTQRGKNGALLIFARYDKKVGAGHDDKRLVAVLNQQATYKPRYHFVESIAGAFAKEMPKAWAAVVKRQFKQPSRSAR